MVWKEVGWGNVHLFSACWRLRSLRCTLWFLRQLCSHWFRGSEEGSVVTCVLCLVSLMIFPVEKPTTVAWGPGHSISSRNTEKIRELTGQPNVPICLEPFFVWYMPKQGSCTGCRNAEMLAHLLPKVLPLTLYRTSSLSLRPSRWLADPTVSPRFHACHTKAYPACQADFHSSGWLSGPSLLTLSPVESDLNLAHEQLGYWESLRSWHVWPSSPRSSGSKQWKHTQTHMAKGDLPEKAEVTLQSHKAVSDWGNPLRLIS